MSFEIFISDAARVSIAPWANTISSCAESAANKSIYQRLGVDERQLTITGSQIDDTLYEVSRHRAERVRALALKMGFDPDRMLIVVAFPPDQFGAPSTNTFEYTSFTKLIDGWLQALAQFSSTVNIVLRPHPRLDPEILKPFEQAGCHVFSGLTEEIVPLADVFVASISATIRWALALGIPVINYDCYRYRYDDYNGAQGMLLVEDRHAFAAALHEVCSNGAVKKIRDQQKSDSASWGCIDGQFSKRFLRLLRAVSRAPDDPISVVPYPLPR
jgi:UDP-N-acetylglucosamine 2-epimerase